MSSTTKTGSGDPVIRFVKRACAIGFLIWFLIFGTITLFRIKPWNKYFPRDVAEELASTFLETENTRIQKNFDLQDQSFAKSSTPSRGAHTAAFLSAVTEAKDVKAISEIRRQDCLASGVYPRDPATGKITRYILRATSGCGNGIYSFVRVKTPMKARVEHKEDVSGRVVPVSLSQLVSTDPSARVVQINMDTFLFPAGSTRFQLTTSVPGGQTVTATPVP